MIYMKISLSDGKLYKGVFLIRIFKRKVIIGGNLVFL